MTELTLLCILGFTVGACIMLLLLIRKVTRE